jgi:hypothetical protein
MKGTTVTLSRKLIAIVLAAAGFAALASGVPADAHTGHRKPRLTAHQHFTVLRATWQFRDVDAALAAGYVPVSECTELPGVGGMGIHYLNRALAGDTVVDPKRPEVLVYQEGRDGELRLGAVEYFVADADQDLATDEDRPSLFGRYAFDGPMEGHEPGMPVHYDLHVWLYKHNPAGQLAAWNPRVSC